MDYPAPGWRQEHQMDARVPGTELVRYDAMCRAIDSAYEVDEVKDIHDKAQALELYERLAKNIEAEDRCYQIRWRAATKAGELLTKRQKAKGAAGNQYTEKVDRSENYTGPKTLAELGISKQQSFDWQKLAAVPKDEFEQALVDKSVESLIAKPTPVSGDALSFIGTLRDFERRGANVFGQLWSFKIEMITDRT
jgi:hypothetical protein